MKVLQFAAGTVILMATTGAQAQVITCGFFAENRPGGKPNNAICANSPDEVMDSSAHCAATASRLIEELHNMKVDLREGHVKWTRVHKFAEHAKEDQKRYYMNKGMSEKEADEKVSFVRRFPEMYSIHSHNITEFGISTDPVTKEFYDQPKTMTRHHVLFGDDIYTYILHVQSNISESILTEPIADAEHAWIRIRFGNCRVE